ncbi:hypothetical protein B0H13DRAFT_2327979 [Mycena leptocephala]|nr:hypothetical protein B0H13DRAFT_2327979 [Mycena leptocephala]
MDEENIPRDLASEEGDKPITSLEPPDGGLNAWLTVLGASLVASATFGFVPCPAVCAHRFKRRLAFAIGFTGAVSSLGGIIYPIMINRLIPRIGFGVALIVLSCFGIVSFAVKTRRPAKPLPPLSKLLAFRAFRDPCYVCLCLGGWFSVFSTLNPFFYVGLYGSIANGRPSITPYYLAIMCATARSSATRIFNVISSTMLSGFLILAMWYTSTAERNLVSFSTLYGFASAPFLLITTCTAP